MDMKEKNIEDIIQYVNSQLSLGRHMKDIEINDFKVNERVITKRLNRKGYKKIDNQFVLTNVIKKDNKNIKSKFIEKYNENIDIQKINELIELLKPLKKLIQEHNKNINNKEIKIKNITNVKQKLFKVDTNVLTSWEEFVKNHKQYKVQSLISLALEEFINKYK